MYKPFDAEEPVGAMNAALGTIQPLEPAAMLAGQVEEPTVAKLNAVPFTLLMLV